MLITYTAWLIYQQVVTAHIPQDAVAAAGDEGCCYSEDMR